MYTSFADRLLDVIDQKKSRVVVGLDPDIGRLPNCLVDKYKSKYGFGTRALASAVVDFNREIIEAVQDIVVAVKPQIAFYEALGVPGFAALRKTIRFAQSRGLLVIQDAKRGDIGSTAEAYASAHLGSVGVQKSQEVFGADAITLNPFLGSDSVEPFLKRVSSGKGAFVLVKTSNPSSGEIQDLKTIIRGQKHRVYEVIAESVNRWGSGYIGKRGYSSVGAVVGATFPKQASSLREIMPRAIFLVPGYGAQGGTAKDVARCFNADGYGAIVNSSRDIIFAYEKTSTGRTADGKNFAQAARVSADRMRNEIQSSI